MNVELVLSLLKFLGVMALIMGVIYAVTLATPYLAKAVDKRLKKTKDEPSPERVEENYQVKGPYDKQVEEDFDPNYKIYNTDIYGFDKPKKKK